MESVECALEENEGQKKSLLEESIQHDAVDLTSKQDTPRGQVSHGAPGKANSDNPVFCEIEDHFWGCWETSFHTAWGLLQHLWGSSPLA